MNSVTDRLANSLAQGLALELELTPKPGLVDRRNCGSHPDLSYATMRRSVDLLEDYFRACAAALRAGCPLPALRQLGLAAEQAMWRRFGTNTHRGAIFLGGLLLAGVHAAGTLAPDTARAAVAECARRLFAERIPTVTPGAAVRARFQVGGIVGEALAGLPGLFDAGLPALEEARLNGWGDHHGRLLCMAVLMQRVEDTTALRRCGPLGLVRLKRDGECLERTLRARRDPQPLLLALDEQYRARRLTMGGVADLLGVSVAWQLAAAAATGDAAASIPGSLRLPVSGAAG